MSSKLIRIFGAIAMLAAVMAIAACGGDGGSEGGTLADPEPGAPYCPMNDDGSIPADAFDATEIVGMTVEEGNSYAAERGCEVRITWQDGVGVPSTMDLNNSRINVFAEGDEITEIDSVG